MKKQSIRVLSAAAVLAIVAVGFAISGGIGTLSAIGWEDIALLCPLGALGTMIAAKAAIPRALVSLAAAIVLILLFGRAFCGWVCPVPLVQKARGLLGDGKKPRPDDAARSEESDGRTDRIAPLTAREHAMLSAGCGGSCASHRGTIDSRHFVLGGALVSTAAFGFPVFCLVCPVGLTFASILLVMRLFTAGDATWAVVAVPALLAVEVVFFKKWCHAFCPLGAFMGLIGRLGRTFRPTANEGACLENTAGATCGRCAAVCPEGIDPRHPQRGTNLGECTRCLACVEACPAHAVSLPPLARSASPGNAGTGRAGLAPDSGETGA